MDIIKYKYIDNYDDRYILFNTGKIISTKTGNFMYLTKSNNPLQKYEQIKLRKDGVGKTTTIHRLVAEHFIENPFNLPSVDHIDRDGYNNDASNLRWASYRKQSDNRKLNKHNNTGHAGINFNVKSGVIVVSYYKNNKINTKSYTLSKHGGYDETLKKAIQFKAENHERPMY